MSEWDAISKPAPASEWDAVSQLDRRKPEDEAAKARRRAEALKADAALYDPSAGMSGGEKFLVGAGSSIDKAYRGVKGLLGGDTAAGEDSAVAYQKHRPEGWQTTAGEISGDVASQLPAALVPGGLPAQMLASATIGAATTPGDIEERGKAGALGAGGAAAGQVLTKTLGRFAKPIGDKAADTVALEKLGIEPTFGQGMAQKGTAAGKAIGRAEEAAMSVPIASGPLRRTREAGQEAWRAATREAALPPGVAGAKTVDEVRDAVSRAYTGALDAHPLPHQSVQYAPDVRKLSQGLPITQAQRDVVEETFNEIRLKHMQNAVGNQPTAAAAHGTESDLKNLARRYRNSQDPAQQDLGALFGKVAREYGDSWRGALPPDAARTVKALDKKYPELLAIEDAARKVGASVSDADPNLYTPAVLTRSARNVDQPGKRAYIRQEAPQQELARLGQSMQGKVPDSGTAERAMFGAGGLGGLYMAPATTLGTGAALAAYGTKPVQNYLMGRAAPTAQQALLDALRAAAPYGGAGGAGLFNYD